MTDESPEIQSMLFDLMMKEIELSSVRSDLNGVREGKKKFQAEVQGIQDEAARKIQELRELIVATQRKAEEDSKSLRQSIADLESSRWDLQVEERKKANEVESLQRQIDQARRAELAKGEWKALEERWDHGTMGAPWREWAKDHQIEGGKKITYESRMILGDTMGLGKTLTSLIALDMIQVATANASEDNPIEFGSMK